MMIKNQSWDPIDVLEIGKKYSKKDLAELLNEPRLTSVREGVASCTNSNSYLLFVDLEKAGKEERFHFDDYFDEDLFHWDSQPKQHIDSPKIQEVVQGVTTPHLFIRIKQKEKNKTLPFVYCGRLHYLDNVENTSKPVHIIFQNLDYDYFTENKDLFDVYQWKPTNAGMTTKFKTVKKETVSEKREKKLRKPEKTERTGLVTSRVGQGFYRQQVIEKWKGKCPLTGIDILPILISSHIVPWAESNDEERLDVENGILLSPLIDSLFDKHLISFDDDGNLLISSKLSADSVANLNLENCSQIKIDTGMLKYVRRHRQKFEDLQTLN